MLQTGSCLPIQTSTDFLYQDLSHSTFLRTLYTAERLAITAPANTICFVHGHTYLGEEVNSVLKLRGEIQFPAMLYTSQGDCLATLFFNSLIPPGRQK